MCDLDDDETELEYGEAERIAALMVLGLVLADMLAHPTGMAELKSRLRLFEMLDG